MVRRKTLPWNKRSKPLPWNKRRSRKKKLDIFEVSKHGTIHLALIMAPFLAAIVIIGKLIDRIKK